MLAPRERRMPSAAPTAEFGDDSTGRCVQRSRHLDREHALSRAAIKRAKGKRRSSPISCRRWRCVHRCARAESEACARRCSNRRVIRRFDGSRQTTLPSPRSRARAITRAVVRRAKGITVTLQGPHRRRRSIPSRARARGEACAQHCFNRQSGRRFYTPTRSL